MRPPKSTRPLGNPIVTVVYLTVFLEGCVETHYAGDPVVTVSLPFLNVNWERSKYFLFFKSTIFMEILISLELITKATYPQPLGPLMQTCPQPQPWQGS